MPTAPCPTSNRESPSSYRTNRGSDRTYRPWAGILRGQLYVKKLSAAESKLDELGTQTDGARTVSKRAHQAYEAYLAALDPAEIRRIPGRAPTSFEFVGALPGSNLSLDPQPRSRSSRTIFPSRVRSFSVRCDQTAALRRTKSWNLCVGEKI